jgi:hypothetical protein
MNRIKSRFPQAHDWSMVRSFPRDRVQIWIAYLVI